jgi:hypothetical protein
MTYSQYVVVSKPDGLGIQVAGVHEDLSEAEDLGIPDQNRTYLH